MAREEGLKAGQESGFRAGQESGFKAGQTAVQKEVPLLHAAPPAPPSAPPSAEEVQRKVKTIMNQAYQSLASKFRGKESFQSKEILTILVNTIKVRHSPIDAYCLFCIHLYELRFLQSVGNHPEVIVRQPQGPRQ